MENTINFINEKTNNFKPVTGIILGSGLGDFADEFESIKVPYADIPGFQKSHVAGHKGLLVFAEVAGKPVVMMQGRYHFYEGHSMQTVTFPVKVMKKLGVQNLIVTNAAGLVHKNFNPGDLMLIADHINFMGTNPLIGLNDNDMGPRFPDQSDVYTKVLREKAKEVAKSLNIDVKENTQYFLTGIEAFTGDEKLDKLVKKKIKLTKPVPFNDRIVSEYQKRIAGLLTDEGYIFHLITHEERTEENKVFLTFNIEYLFKVKVTEVVIAGNYLTATWVVRHILRINPGDVLEGDSFQYSRRNMLQTGIFQSVDIDFIDPETPDTEKDIVVTLSESERFKISPGLGVSTDEGVRFVGSFEWKNMFKSGISSKLSLKVSRKIELFMNDKFKKYYSEDFTDWQKTERKINLTFLFQDTYIPKVPLSSQIDAFHIHDIRSNGGLPYMIDKNGLYFSIFRRFSNRYFLSTGFELAYRYEKDYEIAENGSVSYEILKRLVISPEIRGYIDFRDSIFFPTKGWKLSLRYQNTSSVTGDKNRYSLVEGNIAIYIPLQYKANFAGDKISTDRFIFHSFLASAYLIPHSGELSSDDVLKLGGNSTMRGFYTNELMPTDQKGETAEGKFYMFMRNELRIKLVTDLYFISFCDIGNLWEEISHVGEGELFRYTAGGGLLYASPIGSITAQGGFNLKPKEGENSWTIHVFLSTM